MYLLPLMQRFPTSQQGAIANGGNVRVSVVLVPDDTVPEGAQGLAVRGGQLGLKSPWTSI